MGAAGNLAARHNRLQSEGTIRTSAAVAMFDTTKELNIDQPLAHDLLPRSSGRFGGSTIVRHAGNMSGAEVRVGATWWPDSGTRSSLLVQLG